MTARTVALVRVPFVTSGGVQLQAGDICVHSHREYKQGRWIVLREDGGQLEVLLLGEEAETFIVLTDAEVLSMAIVQLDLCSPPISSLQEPF